MIKYYDKVGIRGDWSKSHPGERWAYFFWQESNEWNVEIHFYSEGRKVTRTEALHACQAPDHWSMYEWIEPVHYLPSRPCAECDQGIPTLDCNYLCPEC